MEFNLPAIWSTLFLGFVYPVCYLSRHFILLYTFLLFSHNSDYRLSFSSQLIRLH
jgi:hypothetical protein